MDIRIKTTDFTMTSAVKKYLDIRVKALEKLLGSDAAVSRCEVEIGQATGRRRHDEHKYFAEFLIRAPRRKMVRAVNNEPTINAAIDNAKEEILRQLRKQKTATTSKNRRAGAQIKRSLHSM